MMNSTLKMGIAVMGALTIQIHVIHAQNKLPSWNWWSRFGQSV